ncbi:hypothetical protein H4P12_01975 [Paracoccus sp. 11-3]|uniref:Uncharacterized protein n=1 Tax=Paracoccus amoyensis TaxID=2760093 RepID=A0A926GDR0_9RHOB|nr:hypothetical protein [Paracoccus amoyensis]MBC9245504.1 hypothetical protein [Paracoccus amoyensis]
MSGKVRISELIAYAATFVIGAGVAYLVLTLSVQNLFGPDGDANIAIVLNWLSPLAGLAAFQLGFGLVTGRWRNLHFWLVAPLITYAAVAIGMALAAKGWLDLIGAGILVLVGLFSAGLIALSLSRAD